MKVTNKFYGLEIEFILHIKVKSEFWCNVMVLFCSRLKIHSISNISLQISLESNAYGLWKVIFHNFYTIISFLDTCSYFFTKKYNFTAQTSTNEIFAWKFNFWENWNKWKSPITVSAVTSAAKNIIINDFHFFGFLEPL